MANSSHPKIQHYVPQFLLSNFASEESQVVCFDKQTRRVFQPNVKNVAAEKWFYDFVDGDPSHSLEAKISELETRNAAIINDKLLTSRTVRSLNDDDLIWVALFIAAQLIRTRSFRQLVRNMSDQVEQTMTRRGIDPTKIENYKSLSSEHSAREFALYYFGTNVKAFAPLLLDKVWILYESKGEFVISDNPVGLQNTLNPSTLYGTIGLAVKGIEIYLPLSSDFTLGLFCKDTFRMFSSYFEKHRELLDMHGKYELRNFVNSVRRKLPYMCTKDNVVNLNSVQIKSAERFLFSRKRDFGLAEQMLRDHPEIAVGPRLEMV
jgi:hypothetical protein